MSPTARSLAYYRDLGYRVDILERWNPHAGKRRDAFGFGDLLAYDRLYTILVQATTTGNMSARVAKIRAEASDAAREWIGGDIIYPSNRLIHVIGWKKYRKAEDGKWWRPTVRCVTAADLTECAALPAAASPSQSRGSE